MNKPCPCKRCSSWAINPAHRGRDGSDADLCDVCYWRKRADELRADAERYRWLRDSDSLAHPGIDMAHAFKYYAGSFLDGVIDAAMKEGAK